MLFLLLLSPATPLLPQLPRFRPLQRCNKPSIMRCLLLRSAAATAPRSVSSSPAVSAFTLCASARTVLCTSAKERNAATISSSPKALTPEPVHLQWRILLNRPHPRSVVLMLLQRQNASPLKRLHEAVRTSRRRRRNQSRLLLLTVLPVRPPFLREHRQLHDLCDLKLRLHLLPLVAPTLVLVHVRLTLVQRQTHRLKVLPQPRSLLTSVLQRQHWTLRLTLTTLAGRL